jgi:hypothetical protein
VKLLIDEPPLQVLPSLAVAIGLNEAIVLQQLHYWLQRTKTARDGRKWVFNTIDDWQEQFPFWCGKTIQRAFTSLEKRGLIITEQPEARARQMRKWYTIEYEALERFSREANQIRTNCPDAARQNIQVQEDNLSASIQTGCPNGLGQSGLIFMHETTSETTTENTHTEARGVCSKHSLENCLKYARWLHDTKQGIKNPEGYAKACYKSGLDDEKISNFLAAEDAALKVMAGAPGFGAGLKQLIPCHECGKMVGGPCSDDWMICPLATPPKEVANAATAQIP